MNDNTKFNKRLSSIWWNMKSKCDNPQSTSYKYFGGKGITYCEEWKIYSNFEQWAVSNGYEDNLTLGRMDKTKNFEPDNCKWMTRADQYKIFGRNKIITCPKTGKTQNIKMWAEELEMTTSTLSSRLNIMSIEKAFSIPHKKRTGKVSNYRLRKTWLSILSKTQNPKNQYFKYYGAKGITCCDSWLEYSNFQNWAIDNGYTGLEKTRLCRKDTSDNFSPENCYWGTIKDVNRNKSDTIKIYYDGTIYTQKELAKTLNISVSALSRRLTHSSISKEKLFHVGKTSEPCKSGMR